jgi:hypothetical protein
MKEQSMPTLKLEIKKTSKNTYECSWWKDVPEGTLYTGKEFVSDDVPAFVHLVLFLVNFFDEGQCYNGSFRQRPILLQAENIKEQNKTFSGLIKVIKKIRTCFYRLYGRVSSAMGLPIMIFCAVSIMLAVLVPLVLKLISLLSSAH